MDEEKLPLADPPLLNRFEKQCLRIQDTLTDSQKQLIGDLEAWVKHISHLAINNEDGDSFDEHDMFVGFDTEETLPSLAIDQSVVHKDLQYEELLDKCKESLIAIACSDGMIRASKSLLASQQFDEVVHWESYYFASGNHDSMQSYFRHLESNNEGHKIIINTFSNINTDISECLGGMYTFQIDKLSTFKAESQLSNRVKHFWFESDVQLLILQCDLTKKANFSCIKLAKFLIEQCRQEYLVRRTTNSSLPTKHACIILHIHREYQFSANSAEGTLVSAPFNFMSRWLQVTIENLSPHNKPLSVLLESSVIKLIEAGYPFEEILDQELLWCLLCLRYPTTESSVNHIK
jgi:hypothetical protein